MIRMRNVEGGKYMLIEVVVGEKKNFSVSRTVLMELKLLIEANSIYGNKLLS